MEETCYKQLSLEKVITVWFYLNNYQSYKERSLS